MTAISNPPPVVPEDNARYTTKEKITDGLVRTACAVAGIALIAIGVTAGLAIAGATVLSPMAICFALIPTGGTMTPLALLAILVTLAAGGALGSLTLFGLPICGGLLIAKAVTGEFPDLSNTPTHQNRYDGFNWNPG